MFGLKNNKKAPHLAVMTSLMLLAFSTQAAPQSSAFLFKKAVPQLVVTATPGDTTPPVAGAVSLSANNLQFTGIPVGATSSQTVTLTNNGTVPVLFSSIEMAGTSQFGKSQTCTGSLAPGASCLLTVTYNPALEGQATGQIDILTQTGVSQTITVQGLGLQGIAELSRDSVNFSPSQVGVTTAPEEVSITNAGSAPLSISGISVDQGLANFNQENTCADSLLPGASCSVSIAMTPSVATTLGGRVLISHNGKTGSAYILLNGSGQAIPSTLGGFSFAPKTYGDSNFAISGPTSNGGGQISYVSSNPAVATISANQTTCQGAACFTVFGNMVQITGVGTTTITATQYAYGNYAGGTISADLTVTKATPTVGVMPTISKLTTDAPFSVSAPSSTSVGAWTYVSSNPAVASISNGLVTVNSVGVTTITGTQAATATHEQANASTTLTVEAPVIPNASGIGDGISKVGACAQGQIGCATMLGARAANIYVTNSNTIYASGSAPGSATGYASGQASIGRNSGKWYWEATLVARTNGANLFPCNVAPANFNMLDIGGFGGAAGFGGSAFGTYDPIGTVYSCELDLASPQRKLTMKVNGAVFASVNISTAATLFPTPAMYAPQRYTFNFGQSNFTYAVPAGYASGLY